MGVVKTGKNFRKLFLASIRPPRPEDDSVRREKGFKPLYDIPFMFEAREFLRKKLIGQQVHVVVDYVQAAREASAGESGFPEKTCCTVTIGGVNVAEALVSKGYASCVRYSADNDQRSSKYDDLLAAEDKAQKSNKGMHGKKTKLAAELQTLVVTWPKVNSFCLSFRELEECRLSWSLLLLLLVTGCTFLVKLV